MWCAPEFDPRPRRVVIEVVVGVSELGLAGRDAAHFFVFWFGVGVGGEVVVEPSEFICVYHSPMGISPSLDVLPAAPPPPVILILESRFTAFL